MKIWDIVNQIEVDKLKQIKLARKQIAEVLAQPILAGVYRDIAFLISYNELEPEKSRIMVERI
jgi:hypothetical protein